MTEQKNLLNRICHGLALAAGTAVILLGVAQIIVVILRYIFSFGMPWGLDLLVYLFLIASVLPLPLIILENHNVRVDIFYQGYHNSKKALWDRFGLLFFLCPSYGFAAYVSWKPMLNSWRLLESSPTMDGLPGYFLLKTLLFLGFASLSFISLVLVIKKWPWDYPDPSEEEV